MRPLIVMLILTMPAVLGCVSLPRPSSAIDIGAGARDFPLPRGGVLHVLASRDALSTLSLSGSDAAVTFPDGVLVKDARGRLVPATGAMDVTTQGLSFLAPYNATSLEVKVGDASVSIALPESGARLVSGDRVVELLKLHRERFPHRSPGMPNYQKAIEFYQRFFAALDYTVEVANYDGPTVPADRHQGPGSLDSVVAYKKGTTAADRYLVFGGHFDLVEAEVEGAFDNTGGASATLAMAEAFRNITTSHTIVFALWGGEEDGDVGSNFWATSHPQLLSKIDGYYNFDVTGLAWPAPKAAPSPILVAAGPDGPVADALIMDASTIEKTWMRTTAEFRHVGVAAGQATRVGPTAQSDHDAFITRGIPAYFAFTGKVDDALSFVHKPTDTLDNLTRYSLLGMKGVGQELSSAEMKEGEYYLARSFETQMALGFYWVVLTDDGTLPSARVA